MTRERIDALERDKAVYWDQMALLRRAVDRLGPENSRLKESLDNAEANNVYATVFISISGFLVSYASFTDKLAKSWAIFSAGMLVVGVGLLIWHSFRRWLRKNFDF